MKVILNQDVANLGDEGDVKVVADGYARNFLLPQKKAVPYTAHWAHLFEQRKAKIEARKEQKRQAALGLKEQLNNVSIELSMTAGDNGKLFGAVSSQTLVEQLALQGLTVEKRQISIPGNTLKVLGTYDVKVKVLEKEFATIKVIIKPLEA